MKKSDYWKSYYNDPRVVNTGNPQKNIGRTRKGVPISEKLWEESLDYIRSVVQIHEESVLAEFCCGNGMIIGPLSKYCGEAIGVGRDFVGGALSSLGNFISR